MKTDRQTDRQTRQKDRQMQLTDTPAILKMLIIVIKRLTILLVDIGRCVCKRDYTVRIIACLYSDIERRIDPNVSST